MGNSILPNGEELKVTPQEVLRYVNPDALRQLLRQERLRWNLKPNKDADYHSNTTLHKYTGSIHNEALYQRMEIRTFPDNDGYDGYAGVNNDSGEFGIVHNLDKWDESISAESLREVVNRTQIGAMAYIPGKIGFGLDSNGNMVKNTEQRQASILFDPYDGRAYLYSNDDPTYVNNETRSSDTRLPSRTVARVGDIPTRITDLKNDLDFIADPDYHHTDNNFTNSNRFIVDNLDDRTFVYPEIAKDKRGSYIENYRVGLDGKPSYAEGDGVNKFNSQPDLGENPDLGDYGDRFGEAINSYNINSRFSGVSHRDGYLPGIFRSYEELERVDLIDQIKTPLTHADTPGAKRAYNYYIFDGIWSPTWFDRYTYNDSYLAQSLYPTNMEVRLEDREPVPYSQVSQEGDLYNSTKLYQWRYNRVSVTYNSDHVIITIVNPGEGYRAGDILRWTFGDDVLLYKIITVGANGQIQKGEYVNKRPGFIFEQDPSTHGVGIPFSNTSEVGGGALLAVFCRATISTHATQIKNNLYAYVDVVPSVRSDNSTPWSDVSIPSEQNGVVVRSTAASPAYSGINAGRGGPSPKNSSSMTQLYEHGGNATAGVHVHLFKYVINTQNPTWVIRDGIQIFTGRWVDQGPMGVERPCDIKALLFSNPDTNNFNNYYKFMMDIVLDSQNRNPDAVSTNNPNAVSQPYIHIAQRDPLPDQKFTETRVNPDTSKIEEMDITSRVLYINGATGVFFFYNSSYKNDPTYGYGTNPPGWKPIGGYITR